MVPIFNINNCPRSTGTCWSRGATEGSTYSTKTYKDMTKRVHIPSSLLFRSPLWGTCPPKLACPATICVITMTSKDILEISADSVDRDPNSIWDLSSARLAVGACRNGQVLFGTTGSEDLAVSTPGSSRRIPGIAPRTKPQPILLGALMVISKLVDFASPSGKATWRELDEYSANPCVLRNTR